MRWYCFWQEFIREVLAYSWSTIFEIECVGECERNSLTVAAPPFPQVAQLSAKGGFLGLWFLLWGKVRAYKSVSGFPAFQGIAKETHFSLATSRILSHKLYDWLGGRSGWEKSSQGSEQNISRGHGSNYCIRNWVRRPTLDILWMPPSWPTGIHSVCFIHTPVFNLWQMPCECSRW